MVTGLLFIKPEICMRCSFYFSRQWRENSYSVAVMMNEIYNRKILELAANIPLVGRLENPMASATRHSKLCGSTVTVDLDMAAGRVSRFGHEVKACALGQAASSIMARHVLGATGDELKTLLKQVRAMLKEGGKPPEVTPCGKCWTACSCISQAPSTPSLAS